MTRRVPYPAYAMSVVSKMTNLPDLRKYFPCRTELPPEPERQRAFDALWAAALQRGEGSLIEYNCPYPKYEFLSYLVEQKGYLLHGSNHQKIKVLLPIRLSADASGYGNLEAVYACSDGVWPIYYAISRRKCPKVSLKSICYRVAEPDGTAKKHYYFSIHEEMRRSQPWTEGMIYVLPRGKFRQLTNELGYPVEEWASEEPVAATAKLAVCARDFPFFDAVQVHGDDPPAPEAGCADAGNYDDYVGRYAVTAELVVEVTKVADYLFAKFPGYPPAAMRPVGQGSFLLPPLDLRASFTADERGTPSRLTIRWEGQDWVARRLF